MPANWSIQYWPRCSAHVFLSHCAEDRDKLILPIHHQLKDRQIISWLDQHDYPTGRDPYEALREGMLECRHIVYFVSNSMLKQGRGWAVVERAYGALIQQNLRFRSAEICHIELPLILVDSKHPVLQRSVWRSLLDKGVVYAGRRSSSAVVTWAVDQIERFVRREEQWGFDMVERVERDSELRKHFGADRNLVKRIIAAHPAPVLPTRRLE